MEKFCLFATVTIFCLIVHIYGFNVNDPQGIVYVPGLLVIFFHRHDSNHEVNVLRSDYYNKLEFQRKDQEFIAQIHGLSNQHTIQEQKLTRIENFVKNESEKMANHVLVLAQFERDCSFQRTTLDKLNQTVYELVRKQESVMTSVNETFLEFTTTVQSYLRYAEDFASRKAKLTGDVILLSDQIKNASGVVSKNSARNDQMQTEITDLKLDHLNVSRDLREELNLSLKFRQDSLTATVGFTNDLKSLKNELNILRNSQEEKRQKLKIEIAAVRTVLMNSKEEIQKLNVAEMKKKMEEIETMKIELKQTLNSVTVELDDQITIRKNVTNYLDNKDVIKFVDDLYDSVIVNKNDVMLLAMSDTIDRIISLRNEIRNIKIAGTLIKTD